MGVVAQVEDAGYVLASPSGAAAAVVRRYEAHSFVGLAPGFHRGLPSRALTFRFSLDGETEISSMPDPAQSPAAYDAFVGGLHSAPALVAHDGSGCGIGVDVSPLAAWRLFGVPAGALGSVVVGLDDLFGGSVTLELCERLHASPTWAERFGVLDDVLGRVVTNRDDVSPSREVTEAWRCIIESRGTTTVAAIARHVGWSRRHLLSRFRMEIGLSPKEAIRVVRFEHACGLLLCDLRPSIAAVAASTGFYDQAHLTREWSELAGCTPTEWLADELHDPPRALDDAEFPFIQDSGARRG